MRAFPVLAALLLVLVAVGGGLPALGTVPTDAASRTVLAPGTATEARPVSGVPVATPAAPTVDPSRSVANTSGQVRNATEPNVSRILSLPPGPAPTTAIESVTIDVGIATSFGTNASAARMETIALRERVTSADTTAERRRLALGAVDDIETRTTALRLKYQTAVREYANGGTTARNLVVELARIQANADELAARLRALTALAEEPGGFELDTARVQSLLYDLETFGGPVTERVVTALRGDEDPTRVYVGATGASVAVTTLDDDAYVREVYRADLRRFNGTGIRAEVARNVTARSYPEIWAARTSTSGSGEGGTFVYEVTYPSGHLTAFVDGGTERVFSEHQRINVTTLPNWPVANNTQNGLTLSVNRTYAGGPLRITLVDADTGDPVDATVQLGRGGDSITVGRTGADGTLLTLSPQGQYYVTAVQTDTANAANVYTSAIEPVTVAEAFDRNASTRPDGEDGTATTPTDGST